MTEPEWLTEIDYHRHVQHVEDRLGPRRARLMAVAFCRERLHLFDDAELRAALDVIERFADGAATRDELEEARRWARTTAVKVNDESEPSDPDATRFHNVRNEFAWAVGFAAATPIPLITIGHYTAASPSSGSDASGVAMRALVWDIAGNPFRPVAFDPEWRTETVLALARRMYETREFSAMPILADALQDAGCDDERVQTHCRDASAHVRGCWVLDGILRMTNDPPVTHQ